MPTSQSGDISDITTSVNHIPENQALQAVLDPSMGGGTSNSLRYTQPGIPRTMQWFFIVLVTLWLLAAMALPFVAFCLTHNPFSFSFFGTLAPPIYIMRRIVWYIFPRDDRDYKLKEAQAKYASQNPHNKKRVP